jgi:twitching motility two-component system response regulator PilH
MGRILIIEDSLVEIEIMKRVLQSTPHTLIIAKDGEDGIEKAKALKPHLILMDVVMPKKNGFQVCRELRKDPQFKNTPIILVSSKDKEFDKVWGKQQGASDYLVKPYNPEDLLAIVNKYLGM